VFYDLKKLLEDSKAAVPGELARSEAAKQKPGAVSQKREITSEEIEQLEAVGYIQ
jgi:hypothetical protein